MSIANTANQFQQLETETTAASLKRPLEESNFDTAGTPAKRAVGMQRMDFPYVMGDADVDVLNIPENSVGLVIGKGGSEIQNIQMQSGCRVQMGTDGSGNNGMRPCTLQGPRMAIETAKALINDVISRSAAHKQQNAVASNPPTHGTASVDILIPSNKCGLIVGSKGETIRQLQEQSGCKMHLVQNTQAATGLPKPLRISGDPDKVELAQRLVEDLLSKDVTGMGGNAPTQNPQFETPLAKGEVIVPRASVGMIIGKGGENIKRLAMETGTKIQFKPDEDANSAERCAVIMGTREQIYKATEKITEIVNKSLNNGAQATPEVFYMHVHAGKTGLIIGKGGETIKQINAETGAHCELSRDPPPNQNEKIFVIKGTPYQIHHAIHIIRIKVGDLPEHSPLPQFNNAQIPIQNFSPIPPHMQQQPQQFSPYQQPQQQPPQQYQPQPPANPVMQSWATGNPSDPWRPLPQGQQQQPQPQQAPAQPYAPSVSYQPQSAVVSQPAGVVPQANVITSSSGGSAPSINPQTGQPDYSAQWAEYYRSVGLHEQAAIVEAQMKLKQQAASQNAPIGGGLPHMQQTARPNAGAEQSFQGGFNPMMQQQPGAAYGGSPYGGASQPQHPFTGA